MNNRSFYFKMRWLLSLVALGLITTTCFWLFQKLDTENHDTQAILNLPDYQFDTNPEFLKGKEKLAYYKALSKKYAGWTKKDMKKLPKKDRIDLAWIQNYELTADPITGEVAMDARIKANEQTDIRVTEAINQRRIDNVNWVERGPNNVGGRTRAIMYDPNDATGRKVWAGGVGGGLWYTNDITETNPTWVAVDNFWENIAISTIAYDPSNTQVFYVGTGEGWLNGGAQFGAGIWKTTDGGATWNRLASSTLAVTPEFAYITKIVVTPTGRVLATCRNGANGGVYSSVDGGNNWLEVLDAEGGADLEVAANGDIYASINFLRQYGYSTGQIHKSTTDGATWTNITPASIPATSSRIELASAPTDAQVVYAIGSDGSNIAFFKKTVDGGTLWTDVTVPKYLEQGTCAPGTQDFTRGQSWYDLILKVNPTDADHVVVGGIDVHRSTDGGNTWTGISYWTGGCGEYVHADIHEFAYKPGSGDEMLVGSDGGISRSANIQAATPNFADKNSGYNVTQFYAVAMDPANLSANFLAGAQDNGTQRFTILGTNPTTEATGGDGAFCFIDQDNSDIQISSYVYNNYRISTDGGNTFTPVATSNDGSFINPTDYDDATNLLYSYRASNGSLYRWAIPAGTKTGITVSNATGNTTHLKASPYSPAGTTTLYVGTSTGRVVRIANAHTGTSFTGTDISSAAMQGSVSVSSIEFGASENEIIVTYSNYGSTVQNVWYTNDGGTTWVSKDNGHGLPNMPVRWAMFNPNDTRQVLIATETGVWSTDDITAAPAADFWEPTSTGLANTRCDMLQIRESDNLVAVATHGRGLFTTNAFSPPAALFGIDKNLVYAGTNVLFTDYSAGATSWSWDFGTDATPATANTVGPHTVTYSTPGVKTITLTINGGGSADFTMTKTITVLPNRNVPYELTDGGNFEVNATDFAAQNVTGATNWERGNSAITGKDGVVSGANAWVTGLTEGQYGNNSHSNLYTPNFNFSAPGAYTLSFQTKHDFEDDWDGMIVEYSTNKGTSWTKLGATVTGANWYNSTTAGNTDFGSTGTTIMSGVVASYSLKTIDISSLAGNADVAFRVVFRSDGAVQDIGGAIDDFQIEFVPSLPLINLSVSANSGTEDAATVITVTATASSAVSADETVDLAVTGTGITVGDYTLSNTTITIPNGGTTGTVTFTVVDDTDVEPTETATLTIANPSAGVLIGTTSSQDVTIIDNDTPTITLGTITPTTYCAGETISVPFTTTNTGNFGAGNTFTAQLSDASGNFTTPVATQVGTSPISLTIPAAATTGTAYRVRVIASDPNTVVSNESADLTIGALPLSRTIAANPTSVVTGSASTIEVPNSQTGVNYQLQNVSTGNTNVGAPQAGNGGTLTFATGNLNADTDFRIVATNPTGSCETILNTVTVTVTPTPTITLGTINPTTYCAGETVSIPFTTANPFNAGNTFTAQLSDASGNFTTPIATQVGTSPISLTIPATTTTGTGYKVRVVSSDPVVNSNESANLTINALPAARTIVANPVSVGNGGISDIEVPNSEVGVNYQLQITPANTNVGAPQAGNNGTLKFSTGGLTSTTSFRVVATNATTSCSSIFNTVTVGVSTGGGGATTPPLGVPTAFTATGVSTSQINLSWTAVNGATGYLLYTGRTLIATISSGSTTTFEHTGLNPDTYYTYRLVATNGGAQSQAAQANASTFPEAPTVVSNTPSCGTGRVRLVLSGSGSVFRIYVEETGGNLIDQTNTANYSTPVISQTTVYYISVVGLRGLESERTRVEAVVSPTIEASITEGTSVRSCDASTVLTANDVADATYTWLVSGVEIENTNSNTFTVNRSGNYQVRITKGVCTTTSAFTNVRLNYAPPAEILNGIATTFCENGTLRAAEATNATYSWTLEGTVVGTEREVSVSESGEYTLTVTESGCSATDVIQVNVVSLPEISLTTSADSFCPGNSVVLTTDEIAGATYTWNRNGRIIRRDAGNVLEVTTAGEYTVTAIQTGCSVTSNSVNVERIAVETAYLRETETTLFVEPASASAQISNVTWMRDGEEDASLSGETITPIVDGNYSAIVTYDTGCSTQTRTVFFTVPEDPVTGEDEELAKAFRIYPNPSNGTFRIELGEVKDEVTITVMDALGRVVKTDVIPALSDSYSLNLARFASGAYTIQLKTEKGIIIKKLMKE
ncbi:T9SS type A sorting domain-containing protein [Bernardetia sp.]|uniref:T9SS type A sorting domain-containing protein n=1 Tax=Bernardetia sp. TaxID=1937974 RepID=UPI0025BFFC4B|nr:T9SS type A sorting domain-containing protein [Bernardetia sp.]